MKIKTVNEYETEYYRLMWLQWMCLAFSMLCLLCGVYARMHNLETLNFVLKISTIIMFSLSIVSGIIGLIKQVRYRSVLDAEFCIGNTKSIPKDLPKIIGWCKWDKKYREWETNHKDDEGAYLAVLNEVRRRKYKFGGTYHQQGEFGCPVMEDKTVYLMTQRAWGELMSDAWGGTYCDYAWRNKMEDDGGNLPTKLAVPQCKTDEEIAEEQRLAEEAKKRFDDEMKKRRQEQEAEREAKIKIVRRYVSKLGRRFEGDCAGMTNFLKNELPEIIFRAQDSFYGNNMKWILDEQERKRIEKAQETNRKKWLAEFSKKFAELKEEESNND